MREKIKLVFKDGNVSSIFFPAGRGKKGGTCDFATKKCLENCPSYLRTNKLEKKTYSFFKNNSPTKISDRIWENLKEQEADLLQWFAWGDCPKLITSKIIKVMRLLSKKEIIQCGFTRNKKLWESSLNMDNICLGFTVEDKEKIDFLSEKGLVAYPDYETGVTNLYKGVDKHHVGYCGGAWINLSPNEVIKEADCNKCFDEKIGCFHNWKGKEDRRVKFTSRLDLIDI